MTEQPECLTVRPGQTLIVRVGRDVDAASCARFKDRLEEKLPGVDVVVVACDQLAVYDPEGS